MTQHTPKIDLFKGNLKNILIQKTANSQTIKIAKNANVYTCGDKSDHVYFIESGQIKLLMLSSAGKECLLAIHIAGDIFGELCLNGFNTRLETAIAMEETIIKVIPCYQFFSFLENDQLLKDFVRYLTVRIADQQEIINDLITVDSEKRLGITLLRLAKKLGKKHPCSIIIEQRITQEELSEMVGTTRPRISVFMRRFQERDLIEISENNFIIVKEKNLTNYLKQFA